jgi:hypothetical protein
LVAGKYCGNDMMSGADSSTLYYCPGAGKAPTSATYCSYGCTIALAGKNDYCTAAPATPVIINWSDLNVFQRGNYLGYYLLWDDDGGKLGGSWLSAPTKMGTKVRINGFGDSTGQCATLVKRLGRSSIPWQRGDNVIASRSVPVGTAIATFGSDGRYDNGHSGFFGGYTYDPATGLPNGFTMYDENWTREGLAGSHVLKIGGSYLSNANSYYIVKASP